MPNQVGITVYVKDEATGQLRQMRATMDDMPNSKGVQSGFGMGIGAGIAMAGTQMVIGAVEGMGSSVVTEAMDMETATAKLGQAFKDAGHDMASQQGTIDGLISKNGALGFSELETMDSLAKLVTATGNLGQAQQFQAAAMDLARLKGISLADATDAMTKVEAGQYRMLKSLGIELPAHATALDALTAVEARAGGQAQIFADTTAGSTATLNASLQDVEGSLGKMLLPAIRSFADALRDLLPDVEGFMSNSKTMTPILAGLAVVVGVGMVNALRSMAIAAAGALGPMGLLIAGAVTLTEVIQQIAPSGNAATFELNNLKNALSSMDEQGIQKVKDALLDPAWVKAHQDLVTQIEADSSVMTTLGLTMDQVGSGIKDTMPDMAIAAQKALSAIPDAADTAGTETVAEVVTTMADVASSIRRGRDAIVTAMTQVISDGYDPLILAAQTAADKQALADLQTAASKKGLTAAEKTQLDLQILHAQQAYDTDLVDLAKYGTDAQRIAAMNSELTGAAMVKGLTSTDPNTKADAIAAYQLLVSQIMDLGGKPALWGNAAGEAYTKAMADALKDTYDIDAALRKIRGKLAAASPPGPDSPLHLIDVWGRKTGEAYVKGLATGLAPVGGLMGSLGAPSGGGAKVGGGSSISVVVNNPKPETASTSVQRELLKLAALGYIGG